MPDIDEDKVIHRVHSIVDGSADGSEESEGSNSILQSSSIDAEADSERPPPATPPSRDEILLSRSHEDDVNNRNNVRTTPNTSNSSTSYLGYSTSGTGDDVLNLPSTELSNSETSQSSRLMRKLERPRPDVKQPQLDSISGDIQRKLNKDPFLGYVDLHTNIAEWWESWKDDKAEPYTDENQQQVGQSGQRDRRTVR